MISAMLPELLFVGVGLLILGVCLYGDVIRDRNIKKIDEKYGEASAKEIRKIEEDLANLQ